MCCPGCNCNVLLSWNKAMWMRTARAATSLMANPTQGICCAFPLILINNLAGTTQLLKTGKRDTQSVKPGLCKPLFCLNVRAALIAQRLI